MDEFMEVYAFALKEYAFQKQLLLNGVVKS